MACMCRDKESVEERLHSDTKEPVIKLLYCLGCDKYEAVKEGTSWKNFEDIYKDTKIPYNDGSDVEFKRVDGFRERLTLYLLSQVSYNQYDIDTEAGESPFAVFPSEENAKLCYYQGHAVAFYTVKERGSPVGKDSVETFCMTMVDTVYVRKTHRRLGIGTKVIQHIVDSCPNEYIGFSEPLSSSMCKLLRKYLKKHTRLRDRLWLCSYTGEEGYRANLWIELSTNRERALTT